jgi:hypothetical protein
MGPRDSSPTCSSTSFSRGEAACQLSGTLPKGKALWITYDAQAKVTRIVVDGGASAPIEGVPFMKAAWSLWFGKSKPSDIGDALLSQL